MPFFKENVTLTNDGEKWYTAKTFFEWGPFFRITFDISVYKGTNSRKGIFQIKNFFWIRLERVNTTNVFKICPGFTNHCITADVILDQKYQFLIQMYPKNDSIWSMIEINGSVIDHQENDESIEILQNVTLNIGQKFLNNNGLLGNLNVTRIDKMETKEFACSPPGKIYDIGSIFCLHFYFSIIVNVSIS